jgi:hypothetical protein
MLNKAKLIQAAMMMGLSLQARLSNKFGMSAEQLNLCSHVSRGKSGKHSVKRSNAGAQQRAAKKRNNICKHK